MVTLKYKYNIRNLVHTLIVAETYVERTINNIALSLKKIIYALLV